MGKNKRVSARERWNTLQTDKTLRTQLFHGLLTHLRAGYSFDCFPELSDKQCLELLKSYPEEWVEADFIEALRDGKLGWESIGRRQAEGTCVGNSRSWVYNMINRFDWTDKTKLETTGTQAVNVNIVSYTSTQATDNTSKGDL
jgi:hypothetical protein